MMHPPFFFFFFLYFLVFFFIFKWIYKNKKKKIINNFLNIIEYKYKKFGYFISLFIKFELIAINYYLLIVKLLQIFSLK